MAADAGLMSGSMKESNTITMKVLLARNIKRELIHQK